LGKQNARQLKKMRELRPVSIGVREGILLGG